MLFLDSLVIHFGDGNRTNSWHLVTLIRFPLQLMASLGYLQRAGRPDTVKDFDEHELLSWTSAPHPVNRWPLRAGGFVAIEPVASSNREAVVRAMACEDLGMALVPNGTQDRLRLPRDGLVPLLPDVVGCDVALNVSLPKTSEGNLRPSRVVESIQNYLAKAGFERL